MDFSYAKIVWDKSFSTGHIATDLQHQILIDIINDLVDTFETETAEENFPAILDRLQQYAEWHFQREEQCMHEYHCSAFQANKVGHLSFLNKITEFRERSNDLITIDLVLQLYTELSNWLVNHIRKVDCTLNECVNEYDVKDKPQS